MVFFTIVQRNISKIDVINDLFFPPAIKVLGQNKFAFKLRTRYGIRINHNNSFDTTFYMPELFD